ATKEVLARFELERRALAAMNHRCIAKVFDAGATERGEPWVAMELVEGLPLTAYCDKHKLSLRDRLTLFQAICDGVQHAHQKGVVHRDLKPGNVFVVREGESHVPKILDFGLAKATHRDVFGGGLFATGKGTAVGTLEYMSPEQAAGDGEAIDARSDVYSLCVMLYELLCGELPFPSAMLKQAGVMEARRVLIEEEPKKPSTKLLSRMDSEVLAAQRRSSLGALKSALSGDLDWLVMKAMRKEPAERYGAALAMAADIGRYLAHEPLEAGPPSWGYRAKKFLRKYRVQCVAAVAVVGALIAGGVGTAMGYADAREQARIARGQARVAEERADVISRMAEKDRDYADLGRLQAAELRADALWPALPSQIEELERWIAEVDPILQRLPELEAALVKMRRRARPIADEALAEAKAKAAAEVDWLQKKSDEEQPRERRLLRGDLVDAHAAVEVAGYDFEDRRDAERFLQLAKLVAQIRLSAKNGPILTCGAMASVRARLARAKEVAESQSAPPVSWQEAIAAIAASDGKIASPLYAHFVLTEQEGLVPIGMDPESKLWEFVHLPSGTTGKEIPRRDPATGRLVPDGDMGIVFVLLPGGKSWIGTTRMGPERAKQIAASLRREIALASGAAHLEIPELPADVAARKAGNLCAYAWRRCAPDQDGEIQDRKTFGEESLALVAARAAVAKAEGNAEMSKCLTTLAWALVVNGQDVEAKQRAAEALVIAPNYKRAEFEGYQRAIHAAIEQRAERLRMAEAEAAESVSLSCPNYDPQRNDDETPHQVNLTPYFLSKFEMTQGQWVRLTGMNPSSGSDHGNLALPVEQVSWLDCEEVLRLRSLSLPTEAQWEVGCRGGTTTPWWTGAGKNDLEAQENVGYELAVVGSKNPNPFGLCDTHGNLAEWCLEAHEADDSPREGDGFRSGGSGFTRSHRGGSFSALFGPEYARAGYRDGDVASYRDDRLGLRPTKAARL
ncbi:MAG: Serine/threonine-protein kinase PknB, partial [Planctomycetota bacterium]